MSVETIIEEEAWRDVSLNTLADKAVSVTLTHLGMDPEAWEVSVLACNDARIAALNTEFRDKPTPTNVLSWPSEDRTPDVPPTGAPELGDIAIAFETCAREAEASEIPLENHALHLLVHGTLHLLGYDHEQDAEAALMEGTEIAILASLGVPNPYSGWGEGRPE